MDDSIIYCEGNVTVIDRLGGVAQLCVGVIQWDYGLSRTDAKTVFEHVWLHTFGIGALRATGMCRFSQEEIIQMLGQDLMEIVLTSISASNHPKTESRRGTTPPGT